MKLSSHGGRVYVCGLLGVVLVGCGGEPSLATSSSSPTTASAVVGTSSSASPPTMTPKVTRQAEPQPPRPSEVARPRIAFQQSVGRVPPPPLPAAVAAEHPSAYVEISGGWVGRIDTTDISCTAYAPMQSTFVGWEYRAKSPGNPAGPASIVVQLFKAWENKTDGRRPFYSPEVAVNFVDENNDGWTGSSSWGGNLNDDGPTIGMSPDRRTISFSGVTAVRPDSAIFGIDSHRITWIAMSGTITCPEPLPDLPR